MMGAGSFGGSTSRGDARSWDTAGAPMAGADSHVVVGRTAQAWSARALAGRAGESSARPNIALILADDLGFDLSCYGHPHARTPHLDRLAGEGVRLSAAYAAGTTCAPSRIAMMSGRSLTSFREHPLDHGMGNATLPHMLREEGYITAHFGKWHLGPIRPTVEDTKANKRRSKSVVSGGGFHIIRPIGPSRRHEDGRDGKVFNAAITFVRCVAPERSRPEGRARVRETERCARGTPPDARRRMLQRTPRAAGDRRARQAILHERVGAHGTLPGHRG